MRKTRAERRRDEKKWIFWKIAVIFLILAASVFVVLGIASFWKISTSRMSARADCEVNSIEYITMNGEGECMFPLITSETNNYTVCALPNDVHCSGLVQDFPLLRYIVEMET